MSELAWGEVEMLVLDVDGVLTDGGLWVAADGAVTKRFFVRDGSGIVRLQRAGVPVVWLTGRRPGGHCAPRSSASLASSPAATTKPAHSTA